MKYIILLSFIFLFNSLFGKLSPKIDYSVFYLNNDSILVDIYYEFNSDDLNYIKFNNINICNIVFEAEVKSLLHTEKYIWELNSQELNIENNRIIFGTHAIALPNSQFDIKLKYYQDNEPSHFSNFNFKVIPKNRKGLFISDIYFASVISNQDSSKIQWDKEFLKYENFVVPNASKQYFSNTEKILLYLEVYNSKYNCESEYKIEYKILDAVKKVKHVLVSKNMNLSDKLIPETQAIAIPNLATGVYYLEVSIFKDDEETANDISNQKFFYLNFEKGPELEARFTENELFEKSEFITMDEETITREYDKLKFIMSKQDLNVWEGLTDLKAKQRALFTYWRSKDTDTTTYYNEAKEDFDKAVRYANQYYQFSPSIEGWRTDRGRVLLKYGFPMVVEKFPRNGEKIPCEIWYYGEAGGGMYFYFVDNTGFNNFILAHSTIFGENQNEYWIEEYNPAINFEQNIKRSDHYFK